MKISPKKSLGQNFLKDKRILNQIVSLGEIGENDTVCASSNRTLHKILLKKLQKFL